MKNPYKLTVRLDARSYRRLQQHAADFETSPSYMGARLLKVAVVRYRAFINTLDESPLDQH